MLVFQQIIGNGIIGKAKFISDLLINDKMQD